MKRSETSLDFFIFPAISWNANSSIAETFALCQSKESIVYRSEEGLMLETSAFTLCSVANLRYQLSW